MTTLAAAVACWILLTLWGCVALRVSPLVPLSTGLTVGIVYAVAIASRTRGWPLFKLLFQLSAGVNVLNIQIENLVFGTVPPGVIARTTATGILAAAGVSAALASLWPFLRTMNGRRAQAALLAGLALPVLGGVSPLLLPIDDILPAEIRRVHIAEIFGSNFLSGVITAWTLVRRPTAVAPVAAPARS